MSASLHRGVSASQPAIASAAPMPSRLSLISAERTWPIVTTPASSRSSAQSGSSPNRCCGAFVRASQERCAAAGRSDWRGALRISAISRGRSPAAIVVHRQVVVVVDRRAARRGTQPSTLHIGRGIESGGCPRPRPGGRGQRPRAPPTRGV